jgi:hypothetical protein
VPETSAFEAEMAIEKLKGNIKPGIDQIPAELLRAESRTIFYENHKLSNSIWNKNKLPEEVKKMIIVHIYKKGEKTYKKLSSISILQIYTKFY